MSLQASVGISQGDDSYAVGANAAQDALDRLGSQDPGAILVFASAEYDQAKMLAGIRSVTKNTLLVGCSTAGEITAEGPVRRSSVAIMALRGENISFFGGVGEHIALAAESSGKSAASSVTEQARGGTLSAFFMLFDVLSGNGADIVRGALANLGEHFPVVGGAAGDDFEFRETFQYLNGRVYPGAVVGLGVTGTLKLGIGVKHGWVPIGLPRVVTRSEGHVLHELDGRPAIGLYEEYFGPEQALELKTETLARLAVMYPLGMRAEGGGEFLIRHPITVGASGSITCTADIPQGSKIRLMIGSREEALRAAREAATNALAQFNGATPRAVILFSSVARSKLFGERSSEEIDAIQEIIGLNVPLIGFYTYGELAPPGGTVCESDDCNSVFHNETVVVAVLGD